VPFILVATAKPIERKGITNSSKQTLHLCRRPAKQECCFLNYVIMYQICFTSEKCLMSSWNFMIDWLIPTFRRQVSLCGWRGRASIFFPKLNFTRVRQRNRWWWNRLDISHWNIHIAVLVGKIAFSASVILIWNGTLDRPIFRCRHLGLQLDAYQIQNTPALQAIAKPPCNCFDKMIVCP